MFRVFEKMLTNSRGSYTQRLCGDRKTVKKLFTFETVIEKIHASTGVQELYLK